MGELISLLFGNIAIVLAILGGLYSVFARNSSEKKREKPDYGSSGRTVPKPGPAQSYEQTSSESTPHEMGKDLETYAQQQKERYEQAQQGGQSTISNSSIGGRSEDEHNALADEEYPNYYERENKTPYKRDKIQPYKKRTTPDISIANTRKLNRKKLTESIIMAEVLGRPRSQKPYHSK